MGEFDLIARHFQRPARRAVLGVGDDCALIQPSAGQQLAISTDMLVEGRHFLSTVDPARLGHKALAVNLSDLAACGALPLAFTLSLALPQADNTWLEGFSRGLFALADAHGCELIGGDTTQGPLNISITVLGEVPPEQALLRHAAQAGDDLYVSGTVGDARLALEVFRGHLSVGGDVFERARARMELPTPRVELGQALRGVAHAAIDVSDGLLGDLGHVLKRSGVGAQVDTGWLQGSAAVSADLLTLPWTRRLDFALAGGDDYELLFTAPVRERERIHALASDVAVPVTRIGRITAESGLRVLDPQGQPINRRFASFDHFSP
ncbi:MAG: thiamine-phosphate kinase [Limnohabitans sp.]|jgi:thiamine-monophosphate kinase|nr:thiamine-phosphate kinase [Limnohabitans sp.]